MKRFFITILSILYLASALGATVEIHYCMGKNVGANFVHKNEDKCRKCGMEKHKSKGCCKDEHKTFKTNDHQQTKVSFDLTHAPEAILTTAIFSRYCSSVPNFLYSPKAQINAPPLIGQSCPIYLQIRNIRV